MADNDDSDESFVPSQTKDKDNVKKREYIRLEKKISLCIKAEFVVKAEKRMSFRAFCAKEGVQPSQLRRWTKNLLQMKQVVESASITRSTLNVGRSSMLDDKKAEILPWLNALRDTGMAVSNRMVVNRVRKLFPALARKKRGTLHQIVRRFLRANGIVLRTKTHKAQDHPSVAMNNAKLFVQSTRPFFQAPNRAQPFIINMDQTPVDLSDPPDKTLNQKGAKTINSRAPKCNMGRITAFLTVCADGTKLPPLLVFKGKPGGQIEREFVKESYPPECKYIVQQNAWTDERVMLFWVENVLAPYIKTCPAGIVPYLLLDKYKTHTTTAVSKVIEELGVEWDIIPGGCTGLVQPIDVGIGKPFKNRVRHQWEDFMVEICESNSTELLAQKSTRKMIAVWAKEAWHSMPTHIVKNSWRNGDFSYFPEEPPMHLEDDDDSDLETTTDNSSVGSVGETAMI
jgi:hypothetical protein